jgi:hypothetical protein
MRRLPPPEPPLPDLGEGFPAEARQAIEAGEHALVDLRENTVHRWYLVGGACFMLRNVSMHRSGSNTPTGKRYNQVFAVLAASWPQLPRLHKGVRSDSVWLFENYDDVRDWLATLPQNQPDMWTHPSVLHRQYNKRHPSLRPDIGSAHRPHRPRHKLQWNWQSLQDRSREDLEAMIAATSGDPSQPAARRLPDLSIIAVLVSVVVAVRRVVEPYALDRALLDARA